MSSSGTETIPEINVFDLDGTLYELEGGSYSSSPLSDEVESRARQNVENWVKASEIDEEEFWERATTEYGEDISLAVEELLGVNRFSYFNEVWDFENPERFITRTYEDVFNSLGDQPNIVVTAAPQAWAEKVIEYLGIEDDIKYVRTGEGEPRKPDPKAFQIPINKALDGRYVEEAWFIGDQTTDFPSSRPENTGQNVAVYVGSENPPWNTDFVLENVLDLPEVKQGE